ncbi:NAD-dependent epimerase/dehydratase family protein [Thiomicrospira sp. ALE5]|uniref:NAD-dependent epimerase/dehydratase family protein n=1 Tax=Thiomicrospira sp. ALE5 TaxID=748650 RepID=UPI000B12EBF0|nr:NAD-dependent epimerase/dehydratase family protein [Thiomicrospira sp. ALE5]
MKVFLTGATGFVGSALLQRFVADGIEVTALVRNELVELPDGVEKVVGDLAGDCRVAGAPRNDVVNGPRDDVGNSLALTLKDCDVVVHAAARAHIMRDEVADPLAEYRRVNRDATLALARLATQAGVKRFVFVSSVKVNGEITRPGDAFVSEITQTPIDPYGLSKYEAEQGLLAMAKETGVEVVITRPPLVYGANAPCNFGSLVKWVKKGVPLPLGAALIRGCCQCRWG